jgi:hypothetical protein
VAALLTLVAVTDFLLRDRVTAARPSPRGETDAWLDRPWPYLRALTAYDALFARPLFTKDRVPAALPGALSAPRDPIDSARVVGILSGPQGTFAMVDVDGATQRVQEGDAISNWTVSHIGSAGVTLERAGQERILSAPR